jgi:hypothetical protein
MAGSFEPAFVDRARARDVSFIEDAKTVATMAIPGPGAPDDAQAAFDAMPIAALAAHWRMAQFVSVKAQTEETWTATRYFNSLPHESPVRTYEMVLVVLAAEPDMSVRLRLDDVMSTLIHVHGAMLVDRIEADAAGNAALRWLLGGGCWWSGDKALEERLTAVADIEAFRADHEAHRSRNAPIDFDTLSIDELARVWIEQTDKPFKDHDTNWQAFQDYQRELIEYDPDSALDLVVAVLKVESNPFLLSVLAAGLLEDVIDMPVMDRIEREAAADPRFLALLGGVWYSRKPDDVKARLDAIMEPRHIV